MKILVTGGCGNMGAHIINALLKAGHSVRVLDRDIEGLKKFDALPVEIIAGDIADKATVQKAVAGTEAILHLAWSFSPDLITLMDIDIKGYQYLLDAAVEHQVKHVINTTTAVSYGKPLYSPVDEKHPHLVEQSRNPAYGLAKVITEEMGKICAATRNVCVNNLMIWYAYGDEIGGRHLRGMVRDAIEKGAIEVPAGSGGTFLQLDDFVSMVLSLLNSDITGELFNAGSIYLSWEELAQIIVSLANPQAKVIAIPKEKWTEGAFLTEDWHFSLQKAADMLQYGTGLSRDAALENLTAAVGRCVEQVRKTL